MAIFVKMEYRNTKSWYRVLISRHGIISALHHLPAPDDGAIYLENIRGGRLELDNLTSEMTELNCVEAENFDELNWTDTILDDKNASHGWLTTDGRFWGHEYGLIDEAARFALRDYAWQFLGEKAKTYYRNSMFCEQEQLWDTGAVYIHSKNNSERRHYTRSAEIPLVSIQREWLIDNGFKLEPKDQIEGT